MGKYTEMSKQVLEKVGGLENITQVERCATRLRIHYASKAKVDVEAIKQIENVVGVVAKTGQVQIIIGPTVNDAFNDFLEVSGWTPSAGTPTVVDEDEEPEKKDILYWLNKLGNYCAAVFMPIIPALITGGLILSIKNLLVNYFGVSADSGFAVICTTIQSAGFSLLPIWIGWTLANKLKMEPIMGGLLGAVLTSATISGVEGLDFLGIPVPVVTYTSSVIPVVLGVIFMYWVDKLFKKIIPDMFIYFLKPLLTMIVVVPVTLILLGPIGTELSGAVGAGVQALFNAAGIIALPICSALNPYMVMFGLDKAITPIIVQNLAELGYDPAIIPFNFISNIAVGGSALAVAFALRDKSKRGMIASFGITALCGVTEPAFYGSLIMRPRVLLGTAAGAVVGGVVGSILGLKSFVMGGCPGFLSLLFFVDPSGSINGMIVAIAVGVITAVAAFLVCMAILKKTGTGEQDA